MFVDETAVTLNQVSGAPGALPGRVSLYNNSVTGRTMQVDPDGIQTNAAFPTHVRYINYQWDCDQVSSSVTVPGWRSISSGSGVITLVTTSIASGAPAAANEAIGVDNHPGILTIASSSTSGTGGYITWGNNNGRQQLVVGTKIDMVVNLLTKTNQSIKWGWQNSVNATNPTNGVYFDLTSTGVLTVRVMSASVLVLNGGTGGYAPNANQWYHYQIIVNNSSTITFRIYEENGTLAYNSVRTGISLPTGLACPRITSVCSVGTATRLCQVDFIRWAQPVVRGALV